MLRRPLFFAMVLCLAPICAWAAYSPGSNVSSPISSTTTLSAAYGNHVVPLTGSGFTLTLPVASGVFQSGTSITLVTAIGAGPITLCPASSSAAIDANSSVSLMTGLCSGSLTGISLTSGVSVRLTVESGGAYFAAFTPVNAWNQVAPTGVLVTDTANLTAAFSAAATSPAYLGVGTFNVCTQLTISATNAVITGPNKVSSWAASPIGSNTLPMSIACLGSSSFTTGQAQILITGNNVSLYGIGVDGTGLGSTIDGIQVSNSSKVTVDTTGVKNSGRDNIRLISTSSSTPVQLFKLTNSYLSVAHGYSFNTSVSGGGFASDGFITGDWMDDSNSGAINCIATCNGYIISNNKIEDSFGFGLQFEATGGLIVTGNIINANNGDEFYFYNTSPDITVTGNRITSGVVNGGGSSSAYIVEIGNVASSNIIFSGNQYAVGETLHATSVFKVDSGGSCTNCQILDRPDASGLGIPFFADSGTTTALGAEVCTAFNSTLPGCVPASGGNSATYLNGAGGFTTPTGGSGWPPYGTYDVKATCSATGNGSTDDTTAIQTCINDAEALSTCGTVYLPPGNYLIGSPPLTFTHDGCKLHGEGGILYGSGGTSNNGASLITNTVSTDLLTVKPSSGQLSSGIEIENITFVANSNARTQACLDLDSVMRWHVSRSAFLNCGTGILIQATNSGADNSDWLLDGASIFRNNVNGVKIANFVGGQGAIQGGNYFVENNAGTATSGANFGDIGISCAGAGNGGSVRVIGNRFDGSIAPTTFAGSIETAIYTNCNLMTVMGNSFEGSASPAVWDDQSLGNPAGRGLALTGNQFLLNQTPSLGTHTCAPVISTNTMSCTSVSGVVVGLEIADTTNPTTFQQLSEGSHNALTGGTYVTNISGTTLTLSNNAAASHGADAIEFCQPIIVAPTSSSFLPVSQQNVFQNMSTCMGSGYGNDGQ